MIKANYPTLSPTLENFSKFLQNNRGQLSPQEFAEKFGKVQRQYLTSKQKDLFCTEADILAEQMVKEENHDFAGIIFSALCKITRYFPEKLEFFALKGLKIAKIKGDFVHMMARLNDLRKVYYRNPEKLFEYVQTLYQQEKCLKELTKNYDEAITSYNTVTRQAAPKKDYELMLAHVQTEIGKITKRKHPHDAMKKLLSARETFETRGYTQNVQYINMLLSEIRC